MFRLLATLSLTAFISGSNAFESDFFQDLGSNEQLIAMVPKSNGAARFPTLSEQSAKDRWTAAALAIREAGPAQAQGQVDVMQSVYNRIASGKYGCRSVNKCATKDGQYEPTFGVAWIWSAIKDVKSAVAAANTNLPWGHGRISEADILRADANLQNQNLQQEAARFIKCRTDFNGESEKPSMLPHKGDITRGSGHNFFGNFYPASGNGRCL